MSLFDFWPHWSRLGWLLITPLLVWLMWLLWHRKKRTGQWQQLLPAAFQTVLLRGAGTTASRLPVLVLGMTWLLALLALLGPGWQKLEQDNLKPADPLVILLELTPAMLARDATPNRLEQAKRKLLDLLEAREDAQTAIVVYAGSAHTLVPLSDDLATSRNLLDALSPGIMPEAGQRADLAVARAVQLLEQSALGKGRLLLLGSGIQEHERSAIVQTLARSNMSLNMIGFGTSQGAPIVLEDGSFMKDAQGAILLPRLDSQSLRNFMQQTGGAYQRASLDEQDLRNLGMLERSQTVRRQGEQVRMQAWADQGYWLLLPLLLLAACAGRRGWLLCLPLLALSLPQEGHALSFDDLWLRADQQGQRLLEAQQPAEAAKRFKHLQWQGHALYQAGDYGAAAERFARGDDAVAHYNRGNALAMSNEFEAALEAYNRALQLQPDLLQAQQNKALIEELLRQAEQQQQQDTAEENAASEPQPQAPGLADNSSAAEQSAEPPPDEAAGEPKPATAPTPPQTTEPQAAQSDTVQDKENHTADDAPQSELDAERRQSLEQWLRQIPDDPGELLRRKFWLEQQERQENTP